MVFFRVSQLKFLPILKSYENQSILYLSIMATGSITYDSGMFVARGHIQCQNRLSVPQVVQHKEGKSSDSFFQGLKLGKHETFQANKCV